MSEIAINKVEFFTPAIVTYTLDGEVQQCTIGVDLVSKSVRLQDGAPESIADLVFPFLTKSLHVDSDKYEADESVYEAADRASDRFERTQREYVGDEDV